MSNFEIKTHQSGRAYRTERKEIVQWTILVKVPDGAWCNIAESMNQPCPNCFVITAASEPARESLYYLCLSLKTGRYFEYYLKGSVIPFICISDAKKVIHKALQNNQEQQWQIKVEKLKKINAFEENLKQQLSTIKQLKIALLRS
ncbi:hypothetical protein EC396_14380 [Lutibacter sp. HS1-25]|nr:hypothetical protein EC396_14380 [Lutibacter sp. HS1-25]